MTTVELARSNVGPVSAKAYVVLSGPREVDQLVGTEREARREVRDLKAMGFDKARWIAFGSWAEAEAYEDKARGY